MTFHLSKIVTIQQYKLILIPIRLLLEMYSKKKHLMVYKEQMNPVEIKGFDILFVEWNPFHIFDMLKGKISIKTRFMSKNRLCISLPTHFRSPFGSLGPHRWSYEVCHFSILQKKKKKKKRISQNSRTDGKKVTSKHPFRIYAQDLKMIIHNKMGSKSPMSYLARY